MRCTSTPEPTEGKLDCSRVQAVLDRTPGTTPLLKGHPLLWLNPASAPGFLRKKSWEEVKTSCRDCILRGVSRYRSRIHVWEVVNEAHDWANELKYDPQQLVELTALASQTTRLSDPTAFRLVNNCCRWAEYVATRLSGAGTLDRRFREAAPYYGTRYS